MLRDRDIRVNLSVYLEKILPEHGKICHEQTFHNGKVVADLVTASNGGLHIYEIKGDSDNIERIVRQSFYYNKCAPKLTLVTTKKHAQKALNLLPEFWGLIIADNSKERVSLRYIRKSKNNHEFSKKTALLTLWKSELTAAYRNSVGFEPKSKATREHLAEALSHRLTKRETINLLRDTLLGRRPEFTNNKF